MNGLLTNFPITFFDDVRYTWIATVKGSWMLRNTCERMSPIKGSPMKKIATMAPKREISTPVSGMAVLDVVWFREHS